MKGAAEGARLPASERSPAIVRLPFMFVMLSTISVNRRGPLSMPRAELGIHGLKAGAATGLEKVRETRSSSSQKRSEPAALRGQGGNEHGGSPWSLGGVPVVAHWVISWLSASHNSYIRSFVSHP